MSHSELILEWFILFSEAFLCFLVYARGLHRRLPFFTAYITVLFVCSVVLSSTYYHFGFRSVVSYHIGWLTVGVDLLTRCMAVAELCRYQFQDYPGIWGLSWRVMGLLAVLFLTHAAVDAWGQLHRIAIFGTTLDRDIDISCIVILLLMLTIRAYYGLALEKLQKHIAMGISFICFVDVINNTGLQNAFNGYLASWFHNLDRPLWAVIGREVEQAYESWNIVRSSAFILCIILWCYALRKPLPAAAQEPTLLSPEVYGNISPAVNLRLRAFNDRLLELLRT